MTTVREAWHDLDAHGRLVVILAAALFVGWHFAAGVALAAGQPGYAGVVLFCDTVWAATGGLWWLGGRMFRERARR